MECDTAAAVPGWRRLRARVHGAESEIVTSVVTRTKCSGPGARCSAAETRPRFWSSNPVLLEAPANLETVGARRTVVGAAQREAVLEGQTAVDVAAVEQ